MENRGSRKDSGVRDIIVAEDLAVGFGKAAVLKHLNFSVREGEIFGILGPSGCGKSTLLNTLIGLLPPIQGAFTIGEVKIEPDVDPAALHEMRKGMGVLFQSGALLDWLTISENVAFPLKEHTGMPPGLIDQIVRLKLELVKLEKYADLRPSELSGGMLRRAGLAMAIAMDPKILFCDEPTSGLDPVTAREMDELLVELNDFLGVTIIVVTHEIVSLENITSRCIMLDKEKKGIIASGSIEELEKNEENERVHAFFQRRTEKK